MIIKIKRTSDLISVLSDQNGVLVGQMSFQGRKIICGPACRFMMWSTYQIDGGLLGGLLGEEWVKEWYGVTSVKMAVVVHINFNVIQIFSMGAQLVVVSLWTSDLKVCILSPSPCHCVVSLDKKTVPVV